VALGTQRQDDWGAAIYRARNSLPNAAYDAINCLVNDEGFLYRRGGSAFWSASNAGNTLIRVFTQFYPALNAPRVTAAGNGHFYAFSGTTPVDLGTVATPGRPASVGGMTVFPIGAGGRLAYYGGSVKTSSYVVSAGKSVSTTAGSAVVTGATTAFLANVDAGMILRHSGSGRMLVVKSVDSDTQVTLTTPWPTTNAASTLFTFYPVVDSGVVLSFPFPTLSGSTYATAAGAGLPKLIVTTGNRAYESSAEDASAGTVTFDANVYHELPSNVEITGAEGIGDSCLLFTTRGVWRIDNVSQAPVDDFGNQQQALTKISENVVLWGDAGIAGWQGDVIVPALDNVYIMSPSGSTQPIGAAFHGNGIGPLLKSYVGLGYKPGYASVHDSHYYLPVVNSSNVVQDVLVCRLDRPYLLSSRPRIWGYPWTRWTGHAAGVAYATLPPTSTAGPKLLGVASQRVTDLTDTVNPTSANSQDADGTTSDVTIITRDFPTQDGIQSGLLRRLRAKYVLTGDGTHTSPTLAITYSSDQDADSYSALTDNGLQGGGSAGITSDGSKYSWWRVSKRRERIRFKITVTGASASFIWRTLELLIRPTGRQ
jgi:hypothetical protein